jgi:hypothetical protein
MRQSDSAEHRQPLDHATRRLLKERGTLRCWWCNKRTEVRPGFRWGGITLEDWREFVADNSPYYCHREGCVAHRREAMSRPKRDDREPRQARPKKK